MPPDLDLEALPAVGHIHDASRQPQQPPLDTVENIQIRNRPGRRRLDDRLPQHAPILRATSEGSKNRIRRDTIRGKGPLALAAHPHPALATARLPRSNSDQPQGSSPSPSRCHGCVRPAPRPAHCGNKLSLLQLLTYNLDVREVEYTDEFGEWWDGLTPEQKDSSTMSPNTQGGHPHAYCQALSGAS